MPGDHVGGDLGQHQAGGVGVATQPDQGIGSGDTELCADYSSGLMDLGAVAPGPVPEGFAVVGALLTVLMWAAVLPPVEQPVHG